MMNGQNRSDVKVGATVKIVLKADQRTGKLMEGIVARASDEEQLPSPWH